MYNANMNCNFISEVRAELNFERSYIIRHEVLLSYFNLLEITEIYNCKLKRSLPNDGHLKIKFKTFSMRVAVI